MTLKKADEVARRGKETEEESAKSTQGERRTMANCANTNVGEKKNPDVCDVVFFFLPYPPHLSRPPVSLFHQRGKRRHSVAQ